jgi:hypothetical protein
MKDQPQYKGLTKELIKGILIDVMLDEELDKRHFTLYTGYGGMMTFEFKMRFMCYGRTKLPRKKKKKVYGSKADRLKYLPEYYKS